MHEHFRSAHQAEYAPEEGRDGVEEACCYSFPFTVSQGALLVPVG